MSEKAVLINKIPPISKVSKSATPADSSSVGPGSTTATTQPDSTISPLQAMTYASSVLSFVLAGCMAVVLFRSASKSLGAHLSPAAKLLAAAFGFTTLYGLFVTYLYRNYLYDENLGAPLVGVFALWVVLGAAVGAVLVKVQTKAGKIAALIPTAGAFSAAFICTILSLSLSDNENAALGLSLLAVTILFISALGQIKSSQLFKRKNPKLCPDPFQLMVYLLALVPLALPVLGLLSALGTLGADLSLLLHQITLCGFTAGVGVLMLRALSKNASTVPDAAEAPTAQAVATGAPAVKAPVVKAPVVKSAATEATAVKVPVKVPTTKAPVVKTPVVKAPEVKAPEPRHFDPLIAQMKQEEDAADQASNNSSKGNPEAEAAANPLPKQEVKNSPKVEPKVKLPKAPKPPQKKTPAPPAANKPGSGPSLRAPSKPQKRF